MASTALNVAANALLVPHFGFLAAATMTVATEAVLVGQYLWVLRERLHQLDLAHAVGRPALAALLMGGLALALGGLPLPLIVVAAGLAYAILSFALGSVTAADVSFARSLTKSRSSGPVLESAEASEVVP
jgi:O-antigen/teichoic acid export membrane protein